MAAAPRMLLAWCIGGVAASSDCCYSAFLGGDPHAFGAHGDRFSVRGEDQGIFNVLSAPNVSVNGQFEVGTALSKPMSAATAMM